MKIKIGSHVSFKNPKYLVGAIEESLSYGANCAMIYLGAPQNSKRVSISKYLINEYQQKYAKLIKPVDIIVHAPYIVNPSSCEKYQFAIDFLIKEIERMNAFGAKYLVLHPGAFTKFEKKDAIATLIKSLKTIIEKTQNVIISLETMAGKGTEIGSTLEELSYIVKKVNSSRIGICLDTCHVWEAGYDIENYDNFINLLKQNNLLKLINVIHLNNSKNNINAHKDRHENLKSGKIKLKALMKFVYSEEFANVSKILETPYIDKKPPYKEEINLIKDYCNID